MPLVRIIISTRDSVSTAERDAVVNTLYFNVTQVLDPPDYQSLVNDLMARWRVKGWGTGRYIDIRAYNMEDATPRPIKAEAQAQATGTRVVGVPQVALALSYYADRNLPRSRGRIFLGPWSTADARPSTVQMNQALGLATDLWDLGGVDVDWSLWSPTTQQHTRINHVWVDNSWDIIRSRKLPGTSRVEASGDG